MNTKEITDLLKSEESATLEFKREVYRVDDENPETKKRQRDELVKDILALANGNAMVAGDTAYLVIGADNELGANNIRRLYDVGEHALTGGRILDLVNSACEPSIEDIICEQVEIEGKRILVVTVLPTPYLHETTRRIEPQSGVFSKHTVFVRHDQSVEIASNKERETITQVKRFRFSESKNPPTILGTIVGGTIGAVVAYSIASSRNKLPDEPTTTTNLAAATAGGIAGLIVAGSVGSMYKNFYKIRPDWNLIPPAIRLPIVMVCALASIVVKMAIDAFLRRLQRR
jgi:predicted HTH transcriptional regulator